MNENEWLSDIDKWINKTVPSVVVERQKQITLAVMGISSVDSDGKSISNNTGLLQTTPVETGLARSSWVVSVGHPSSDIVQESSLEAVIRGKKGPSDANFVGSPPSGEEIARAREALSSLSFGQPSFITSSLEYIEVLNDGDNSHIGHHMVERSVVAVEGLLANG